MRMMDSSWPTVAALPSHMEQERGRCLKEEAEGRPKSSTCFPGFGGMNVHGDLGPGSLNSEM